MKWIAIAGTWHDTNAQVESDVRREVGQILKEGNGIITGGALGVDFFAVDEALKYDPGNKQIRIFLPSTLDLYSSHYRKRAKEGVITDTQAEELISQLERVRSNSPFCINEKLDIKEIDKTAYFDRITKIVEAADELIAFQVNKSEGTQNTIDKAEKKGIPVKIYSYTTI